MGRSGRVTCTETCDQHAQAALSGLGGYGERGLGSSFGVGHDAIVVVVGF